MDIYEMLKDDHRQVEDLLDRLADGEDFETALFQQARDMLLVHSHAEDEIVYATLAREPEAATLIEESRQDHQAIEGLLDELSGEMDAGDDWTEKVDDLEQLVAEHVDFEENELIPLAQRLLDDEVERELAERFQARKAEMGLTAT